MKPRQITRHLQMRRRVMVPGFVARHFGHPNRRRATWLFRFLYTSVQAEG